MSENENAIAWLIEDIYNITKDYNLNDMQEIIMRVNAYATAIKALEK